MTVRTPALEAVRTLLVSLGEDPDREGLADTPRRVVEAWRELTEGYAMNAGEHLGVTFAADGMDEMVVVTGITFVSLCEHHVLPFSGVASVAYLPGERLVGLSKLARVVEVFAKRLQIQERLTTQITAALDEHLRPLGSACVIEATHSCMADRGVRQPGARLITSSLTGVFLDKPEVRAEFLRLAQGR